MMKTLLIALTTLMLIVSPGLHGQTDDPSGSEAEDRAAREALRAELQEARSEVAEAARKLARLQRQLADEEVDEIRIERLRSLGEHQDFVELRMLEGELAGMEERIHREVIRGIGMTRPRLGVLLGGDDDANQIVGVTPGSGAEKAGIQAGDRLVAINGQDVDAASPESLREPMSDVEIGDTVPVVVERDGERMSFEVTVSSPARDFRVITHDIRGPRAPGAPDAPAAPGAPHMEREIIVLGDGKHASVPVPPVPPMPPRLAGLGRHSDMISNHAGLEPYFGTAEGVVILRVDADNPLQLEDGDVVLSIDGEAVTRPVEIGRALLGQGGATVRLEVMRARERITLEAELPEGEGLSFAPPMMKRGL